MTCGTNKQSAPRFPPWIRIRYSGRGTQAAVHDLLKSQSLHTVCQGAHCPNQHECFSRGIATFMILGDVCTRDCRFCAVTPGSPVPVDPDEPRRVAEAAAKLNLRHVVVTSVTRDDLPDGGARHFAAVIQALHQSLPDATVEVLTPDFKGVERDLNTVLEAGPDVFNHNLETVRRLQTAIRPAARYDRSLAVLGYVAARVNKNGVSGTGDGTKHIRVKSGLMVGLGETDAEIIETMGDLHKAGVELLTIGQYLAPSATHAPVMRFVPPAQFKEFENVGREMGFLNVAAGPLVRSSYMAESQFLAAPKRGAHD